MIFYIALDESGRRHLVGTQSDARAVNKNFEQIDIPTDKAGLMTFVQDLYGEIDDLRYISDFTREADLPGNQTLAGAADESRGEPSHLPPLPVSTPVDREAKDLAEGELLARLEDDLAELSQRAGVQGWKAFAKRTYAWNSAASGVERALGMLFLAGMKETADA